MLSLILIVIICLISYRGFQQEDFFSRYSFVVDHILLQKDYKRMITSGFLHANWQHLLFNMLALYSFGGILESAIGLGGFALLYMGSLLGGSLLALYIHRNHGDYSAIGASGAISGIIFAVIGLFPSMSISLLFLPIGIPGWLFGFIYVLISIYGIKSKKDNIGHEAHLGGGLTGLIIALIFSPQSLLINYIPILLMLVPSIVFLYFVMTKPTFLLFDGFFNKKRKYYHIDEAYHAKRKADQEELDLLLDKISKHGLDRLTKSEREHLDRLSK